MEPLTLSLGLTIIENMTLARVPFSNESRPQYIFHYCLRPMESNRLSSVKLSIGP